MILLEFMLWTCLGLVAYVYLGYPLLAWVLSRFYRDAIEENLDRIKFERPSSGQEWPFVSLVIAAFREEKVIVSRILNALLLDYPADRIEIIVGCDGDEDCTGELVSGFDDSRVRLMPFPQRRGKASVLNDCVAAARGGIVVFSDANTFMEPQSLKLLVRHFAIPDVGGVCGKLLLIDPASGRNVDGIYWKYENFLKRCEGRLGGLLGVNGGIYAIQTKLYRPIPANTIVDDFLIGMRIHLQGRQLLYEEGAIAREETPATMDAEFHRRARIGAGGFQSLVSLASLLDPRRGWISFTFLSHKVLRWLCPLFMIGAAASNALLVLDPYYRTMLLWQELFYLVATAHLWIWNTRSGPRWLKLPAMFVSMNAALLVGLWRWGRGIRGGTWRRTERTLETTPT